ncbi:MAG: phosphoribosylglycinamide formyltransferase [Pirellulaceae bacterium]|nr:phosphoribosylglycinamide formyltransferase [Pirellulaceae bacterium]
MSVARKLPIAVLISGGGSTLRNLLEQIARRRLDIEVRLVISSSAKAGGLRYANQAGIESRVLRPRDFASDAAYGEAVFGACRGAGVELVVMGGFLKFVPIPADFENRVMNIHPGLIPAFCGQGFYGLHVHRSVLEYGAKVSGCTVHFVDNQYDHGPIILQRVVPVLDDDTPEALAARVFEQECQAYPEAVQLYAGGRLRVAGRRVTVLPKGDGGNSL